MPYLQRSRECGYHVCDAKSHTLSIKTLFTCQLITATGGIVTGQPNRALAECTAQTIFFRLHREDKVSWQCHPKKINKSTAWSQLPATKRSHLTHDCHHALLSQWKILVSFSTALNLLSWRHWNTNLCAVTSLAPHRCSPCENNPPLLSHHYFYSTTINSKLFNQTLFFVIRTDNWWTLIVQNFTFFVKKKH